MTMNSERSRSNHSDLFGNPGPGMFADMRARRSRAHAYRAIQSFLKNEPSDGTNISWEKSRHHISSNLLEVCKWYWSNRDFDERTTRSDMKGDAQRLRRVLKSHVKALEELPTPTVCALNIHMARLRGDGLAISNDIAEAIEASRILISACDPLIAFSSKKTAQQCVVKACDSLWDLRESITGRYFLRTWEAGAGHHRGSTKRKDMQFSGRDALFVQLALQSIDVNIRFTEIRSGLKAVATKKPGRPAKSSANGEG